MGNLNIVTNIINQIIDSEMSFNRKAKVLKLLDKAFRKHYGKIYLSDSELNENDILLRSM